jgi:hypothetical protein
MFDIDEHHSIISSDGATLPRISAAVKLGLQSRMANGGVSGEPNTVLLARSTDRRR